MTLLVRRVIDTLAAAGESSARRRWEPGKKLAALVAALVVAACAAVWWLSPGTSVPPPARADVAYADTSPEQTLDLWLPAREAAPPLVIFVHGGGFSGGDKRDVGPKVAPLLHAGYAVASVNYRLAPRAVFPAAAGDLRSAVRYLRAHARELDVDPTRFALWGESAGADLAALVATVGDRPSPLEDPDDPTSAAVQAVVDWYGPIDLAEREAQYRAGGSDCRSPQLDQAEKFTTGYLGVDVDQAPRLGAAANPLTYIHRGQTLPPFSIAHGSADCLVPLVQSENLAAALRAAGARADLTVLRGAVHADPRFDRELLAPTLTWLHTILG
jgi:acetyl esterase/lipase